MERLPALPDDGHHTPDVGEWAELKYQLVRCYATIFGSAMAGKAWSALTYVDLFAGAGRALLRDSKRIVASSPSVVLDIPKPFSRYVFCELDEKNVSALSVRMSSRGDRDITVVPGDCNQQIEQILRLIPPGSLTFCFVDPFNLRSLKHATLEALAAQRRVDFLVLLASGMDANRNPGEYTKASDDTVEDFTGNADWRSRWPPTNAKVNFGDFVADEFGLGMRGLGYIYDGLPSSKVIVNEKNAPLYRLAFFSRHPLGAKFWDQCKKYTNPQRTLF